MTRYLLEMVVFLTGSVIMVLELVGARLLAPHLGSSIIVWSAIISVILGGLSFGAWWGGRLADRSPTEKTLAYIILWASFSISLIVFFGDWALSSVTNIKDLRLASLVGAFLFGPPSLLLGAVTPFAIRLRLREVKSSGETLGILYALSTFGSILGTLLGGFLFIAHLGTKMTLATLSLVSLITALSLIPTYLLKVQPMLISATVLLAIFLPNILIQGEGKTHETLYSSVWIKDEVDQNSQRPIRSLKFDPFTTQTSIYLDDKNNSDPFYKLQVNFGRLERELVIPYTRFFDLASHFKSKIDSILILGGAGFAYPRYCLNRFPNAKVEVVEIDSGMTELAKKLFNLTEDPRLKIIHEDARAYLNSSLNQYDLVVLDVFNSGFSPPFQLSTKETFQKISKLLVENGVVAVNLISAVSGTGSELYQNEMATLKSIFPQVLSFPVSDPVSQRKVQNQIIIGLKDPNPPSFESKDPELANYLTRIWPKALAKSDLILTDDFAPVEYYGGAAVLNR